MVMAAVVGLAAGKRFPRSSFYSSDFAEKNIFSDHKTVRPSTTSNIAIIFAQKSSNFCTEASAHRQSKPIKALMTHVDTYAPSAAHNSFDISGGGAVEDHGGDIESSLEALILLQKSMLEKQWELSFRHVRSAATSTERKAGVAPSGISAEQRRAERRRRKFTHQNASEELMNKGEKLSSIVSAEFQQNGLRGYVRGNPSEALLRHSEVVHLSKKIKAGLLLEEQKVK
ncbi:RNA polymerase sigma factor sigA-like [Phalaenopsis equestris]|uniref:RNA polymerase sigma factor sigA-like n=1 Tax=Phalaenopsis equestris TaxID=78828 RepID=UPI0009E4D937|nr:RNA polymerase sigma factor sigA-like [Phalaenopsis equestris]